MVLTGKARTAMGASPLSLLLLLVAGAGCPAAHHLAPDLLHKLWVLLLHLLCELLAPVGSRRQMVLPLPLGPSTRPSSLSFPSSWPSRSPLARECQPLPSHQSQQEQYLRLDEAGQVTLLRTTAWRAQRIMASRDHA